MEIFYENLSSAASMLANTGEVLGTLIMIGSMIVLWMMSFSKGIGWGLLCTFMPGGMIFFAIGNWNETHKVVGAWLGGAILSIIALSVTGGY